MKKLMIKLCIVLALQAGFVGQVCSMNAPERPLKNTKWREKNQHEATPARFLADKDRSILMSKRAAVGIMKELRKVCTDVAEGNARWVNTILRCESFTRLDVNTRRNIIICVMDTPYKDEINTILKAHLKKLETTSAAQDTKLPPAQQVHKRQNNRQKTKRPMVVHTKQDEVKLPAAVKPNVQHQPTHQTRHNACLPFNVRLDRVDQRLTALRLELDEEIARGDKLLQQRLQDDKEMIETDTRQGEMGKIKKLEAGAGLYEDGVQDVEMRKDLATLEVDAGLHEDGVQGLQNQDIQTLEASAGVHEDNYQDDFE